MLDKDDLTYKKRIIGGSPTKPADRSLITVERSQKLDLLIHLLANLRQALVVCGPEGIGKSTLLKTAQELRKDQWQICLLQGSSALSFEAIINHLSRFLNLSGSQIGFDLSSLRSYCEKQKVVLIVDDAGELVPGLIGELADFADSLSGLRLVFAMTYDEFHIKAASDKALDDCHFIEIPPLNQKQCAEYLQNLSAQPGAMLSFNAITDNLVADLYRQTNGIPGKILAEIPKLNQYQSRNQSRLGLWVGIIVVLLATGWAVTALLPFSPSSNIPSDKPVALAEQAKPEPILAPTPPAMVTNDTVSPIVIAPEALGPAAQVPSPEQPYAITEAPKPDIATKAEPEPVIQPSPKAEQTTENKVTVSPRLPETAPNSPQTVPQASPSPAQPLVIPPSESKPVVSEEPPTKPVAEQKTTKTASGESNLDWIMAQPASNYALQVMTLSTKDAAKRFLKKYADYGDSLTYYTIETNGQEKFIVIFGSFVSAAEAKQYKEVMPAEFKQSLEKRFSAIQKDSRR